MSGKPRRHQRPKRLQLSEGLQGQLVPTCWEPLPVQRQWLRSHLSPLREARLCVHPDTTLQASWWGLQN